MRKKVEGGVAIGPERVETDDVIQGTLAVKAESDMGDRTSRIKY
jgi:hypothetical protein